MTGRSSRHRPPATAARVRAALADTPRAGFLPKRHAEDAGVDLPVPIGYGQTNSQPTTVRNMLQLLEVAASDHVLDVGAGSGWSTALLAALVGPSGSVIGVGLEPMLAVWGAANLTATQRPWARIVRAEPGVLGRPAEAPYDRVLVSADADALPLALVAQVRPGGVLVLPVRGTMLRVTLAHDAPPDAALSVTTHGAYRFVPLR